MNKGIKDLVARLSEITGCDLPASAFNKYISTSECRPSYTKLVYDCDRIYGSSHNSENFGFTSKFKIVLSNGEIIESQLGSYQFKDKDNEEIIALNLGTLIRMYDNPDLGVKFDDDYRLCTNIF